METAVAVSRDGRRGIGVGGRCAEGVGCGDGRELRTLYGHSDTVRSVAVRGDGQRAVSASYDHTLKIWNVESGELLATFTCDAAMRCCAFNGRELTAGDILGRVHFLRLEEPKAKS